MSAVISIAREARTVSAAVLLARATSLKIVLAFPIAAPAPKGRTLRKTLALLILPAWPLETGALALLSLSPRFCIALLVLPTTKTLPRTIFAKMAALTAIFAKFLALAALLATAERTLIAVAARTLAATFAELPALAALFAAPEGTVVAVAAMTLAAILPEFPALTTLLTVPERPFVAVAASSLPSFLLLARKTAPGEFPLTTVGRLGAVLAAAGPITPAAP